MAGRVAIGHKTLAALVCDRHDVGSSETWVVQHLEAKGGRATLIVQCRACAIEEAERAIANARETLTEAEAALDKISQ